MSAPEGPFPASISFQNCKNLRTLTTFNCKVSAIDSTLISQLRRLRTLNLSHNGLHELPDNIGDLIHLSALKELPKSMGKLINLRHLYIQLCDQLNYLPKGIGRLTSLQTLDICPVYGSEDDEAFKLGDLGSLDQLQGILTIKVLGDWKDANEAENARLWNKKLFHLEVDSWNEGLRRRKGNKEILLLLRPHQDLSSLEIKWYDGTTWPHWMMSLYNLRVLSLDSCYCEFLPPLGKLPFLEKLSVSYTRVRKIGVEFLGIEEAQTSMESSRRAILFPKLKELLFWRLNNLEEWNGMEGWKEEDSDEVGCLPDVVEKAQEVSGPRFLTSQTSKLSTPIDIWNMQVMAISSYYDLLPPHILLLKGKDGRYSCSGCRMPQHDYPLEKQWNILESNCRMK
ncbi:hypothetical protein ACLB2K_027735 [Fragaria x ananassa]